MPKLKLPHKRQPIRGIRQLAKQVRRELLHPARKR